MDNFWAELTAVTNSQAIAAISTVVTAFATVVLGIVTWVLAKETKVLSRATAQAHVTATLEPNLWAVQYLDIIVANSGNAVAYDIKIHFDPPLPDGAKHRSNLGIPLQNISILRPGQSLQSNLFEFSTVSKKSFRVTITWKHNPNKRAVERLSYEISMMDYHDVSYLGARSPFVQIAEQIKKLREDWQYVAKGSSRIKSDVYNSSDRDKEHARHVEAFEAMQTRKSENLPAAPSDDIE